MARSRSAAKKPIPVPTPPLKFSSLLSDEVNKPIPWIIKDLIAEGEQMLVFGAPKVGKSQFVLQMAIAVTVGNDFHKWPAASGEDLKKGRKVLYVNLEIGERSFMRRIADHVIDEGNLGERPDPAEEIPEEILKEINRLIEGKLFFSEGMRTLEITKDLIDQLLAARNGKEEGQAELFVKRWHAALDEIKPELIIFDTLSKMHSLDERENNAIQGVLSLIREICTVQSGEDTEKRRELSHVIVHHSRKNSESSNNGGELSLDAIRGGSAIRAEADVIVGIFASREQAPTEGTKTMPRDVLIEARNIEGDRIDFQFDGIRFRLTTEQDTKNAEAKKIAKIRGIFEENGVRGISTGVLAARYCGVDKQNSAVYKASVKFLSKFAKEGKHLELITKKTHGELIRRSPVHGKYGNAAAFYWIRDTSDWLKVESISKALVKAETEVAQNTGSGGNRPANNGKVDEGKKHPKNNSAKTISKKPQQQPQLPSP